MAANVNKTDIIYWLSKIFDALGGGTPALSAGDVNKTDIVYWLEQIYEALGGKDKPQSVTDITGLTDAQLDALKVGDAVAKVTGKQKHLYLVTYKGEGAGEGIVLTYNACGYGEAVAYDRTDSGWQYNSTDVKTYGD